jgi:hypothetical protein
LHPAGQAGAVQATTARYSSHRWTCTRSTPQTQGPNTNSALSFLASQGKDNTDTWVNKNYRPATAADSSASSPVLNLQCSSRLHVNPRQSPRLILIDYFGNSPLIRPLSTLRLRRRDDRFVLASVLRGLPSPFTAESLQRPCSVFFYETPLMLCLSSDAVVVRLESQGCSREATCNGLWSCRSDREQLIYFGVF